MAQFTAPVKAIEAVKGRALAACHALARGQLKRLRGSDPTLTVPSDTTT